MSAGAARADGWAEQGARDYESAINTYKLKAAAARGGAPSSSSFSSSSAAAAAAALPPVTGESLSELMDSLASIEVAASGAGASGLAAAKRGGAVGAKGAVGAGGKRDGPLLASPLQYLGVAGSAKDTAVAAGKESVDIDVDGDEGDVDEGESKHEGRSFAQVMRAAAGSKADGDDLDEPVEKMSVEEALRRRQAAARAAAAAGGSKPLLPQYVPKPGSVPQVPAGGKATGTAAGEPRPGGKAQAARESMSPAQTATRLTVAVLAAMLLAVLWGMWLYPDTFFPVQRTFPSQQRYGRRK